MRSNKRGLMSQIVKWLAVLMVGALIGYFVGNRQELAQSSLLTVQQETLERQGKAIGQLKSELGIKETLLATQKAAFEQLQQTLKDQEAQVQEQKRQLAFFERIMRPTGEQVGVVIDNLTLQETSIPYRYHYRLALTQPAKKRELFRGQVQIKVEGSQGDKPRTLGSRELGMKVGRGAMHCVTSSCWKATGSYRKALYRIGYGSPSARMAGNQPRSCWLNGVR